MSRIAADNAIRLYRPSSAIKDEPTLVVADLDNLAEGDPIDPVDFPIPSYRCTILEMDVRRTPVLLLGGEGGASDADVCPVGSTG